MGIKVEKMTNRAFHLKNAAIWPNKVFFTLDSRLDNIRMFSFYSEFQFALVYLDVQVVANYWLVKEQIECFMEIVPNDLSMSTPQATGVTVAA